MGEKRRSDNSKRWKGREEGDGTEGRKLQETRRKMSEGKLKREGEQG